MVTLSNDPHWPRAGNWPAPAENTHYDAVLIGVPTYETSLSPTNAHTTPDAIRVALKRYSLSFAQDGSGDTWSHRDLTSLAVADAGNIDNPDTNPDHAIQVLRDVAATAGVVIALGGDNSVTSLLGQATLGDTIGQAGLITLDAHFDLRDGHSNGSPVRELLDAGLPGQHIAQVGIADFANSDYYATRARDAGITVIPRDALHGNGLDYSATTALEVAGRGGGPIHVDIDVDVCDRSVAPATPASVPGGLAAWELRRLVRRFATDPRVASFDITEIDATKDTDDERTIRLAALLVLEILAGIASR